jgi:hypothetical protein
MSITADIQNNDLLFQHIVAMIQPVGQKKIHSLGRWQ